MLSLERHCGLCMLDGWIDGWINSYTEEQYTAWQYNKLSKPKDITGKDQPKGHSDNDYNDKVSSLSE